MSSDINIFVAEARVIKVPEHGVMPSSQSSRITLRLASNRYRPGQNGYEENSVYFGAKSFGVVADAANEKLSKGDKVLLQGEFVEEEFDGQNGRVRLPFLYFSSFKKINSPAGGNDANSLMLECRLTEEVELRSNSVAYVRVASNKFRKDGSGGFNQYTTYMNVKMFKQVAIAAQEKLKKGYSVLFTGEYHQEKSPSSDAVFSYLYASSFDILDEGKAVAQSEAKNERLPPSQSAARPVSKNRLANSNRFQNDAPSSSNPQPRMKTMSEVPAGYAR